MASLTDAAEAGSLAWLLGESPTAPATPLMVALMTANGSDSTPGTEVTGGSYARQQLSVTRTGGEADTDALLRWEGIPASTTVVGVEVWDSAGTAVRWWWGALDASKEVDDGVLEIAAGDLTLTMD